MKSTHGRTLTQLTTDPSDDIMPVFHPAGHRIAFASNRAGNWDIYVMSTDGGQPMKLTDERDHELHPSWSPDGRRLIYCKLGSKSGRWEMWVVDTENPGVRRFLDYGLFPQWCPDIARSKILFQRARQRGSRFFSVWTTDYVNDDAVHPTEIVSAGNAAVINPAWSADGSRIVFVTVVEPDENANPDDPLEQSDVWIVNLDGSGRTNLTNGRYANYQPVWSGDGRVYFVSNRTGVDNIWAVTTARAMEALDPDSARISSAMPGYNTPQRVGQP
jgi:TolB protein